MSDDAPHLIFRVHAVQRMFERGVTASDVRAVLAAGETIEDYATDTPYPSRLVLGWAGGRPVHVVAAENASARETIVITVYEPDPIRWDSDFKRRRP
jgi:hypothetical protein